MEENKEKQEQLNEMPLDAPMDFEVEEEPILKDELPAQEFFNSYMGENYPPKPKSNWAKRFMYEVFDLLKVFVICFVIIVLLTNFVAKPIKIEGKSMYPTLDDGQIGITNLFAVQFLDVSRFDVVIIHNEERNEYWVKRIIALPGETVEGKDDVIYINNEPIDQSFLDAAYVKENSDKDNLFTSDFGPVTLGEDEYWLMGDNRIRSEDSRIHGPFKKSELVGKDVFVFWPFEDFEYVKNDTE